MKPHLVAFMFLTLFILGPKFIPNPSVLSIGHAIPSNMSYSKYLDMRMIIASRAPAQGSRVYISYA
jgi:hypothetical protein